MCERTRVTLTDCDFSETAGPGILVEGTATLTATGSRLRDLGGDGVRIGGSSRRPAAVAGSAPEGLARVVEPAPDAKAAGVSTADG